MSNVIPYIFLGLMGLFGIAILVRSVIAGLFLTASIWLAWDTGLDLVSSMLVMAFMFMLAGELPLYFSKDGNSKLPKVKYAVMGLVVSILWLLLSGAMIYGMLFSDLPSKVLYWALVVAILLADLPALAFCVAFSVPKLRKILAEEFTKLD